ncbi:hypothetical protein EDD21DRAFT_373452 [Dissophora ornata]|nr:hypothetical protein BGZ58_003587 [Dissophora ornata]KAI8601847.1 hypothetical protein EDD21DRAFT_373452 [Dissophora ornata]
MARPIFVLLVLTICCMVASFPQQQLPLRSPNSIYKSTSRVSTSSIIRGHDLYSILRELAKNIDHGTPENWERLMESPFTNGTSEVEIMNPQDLAHVMESWDIDKGVYDDVFSDIETLIRFSTEKSQYAAQRLTYAPSHCQAGERPVCLTTLFVAARPMFVYSGRVWSTELAHMYMESQVESVEQNDHTECCTCWLFCCPNDCPTPRDLTFMEQEEIYQVLSFEQSGWARENMPDESRIPKRSQYHVPDVAL